MRYAPIVPWKVEALDVRVLTEVASLPDDMGASFIQISKLIEVGGPSEVGLPHVRHVVDKLWEMRLKGKAGIGRALYQSFAVQRVIVLRVFVKKTQKTPKSEIRIALQRAKEFKP
jgi:phage-related protein